MQHYPRGTVEASAWCRKCGKETPHRVDPPRLGPCLVCLKALENPTIPGIVPAEPEQVEMFPIDRK